MRERIYGPQINNEWDIGHFSHDNGGISDTDLHMVARRGPYASKSVN